MIYLQIHELITLQEWLKDRKGGSYFIEHPKLILKWYPELQEKQIFLTRLSDEIILDLFFIISDQKEGVEGKELEKFKYSECGYKGLYATPFKNRLSLLIQEIEETIDFLEEKSTEIREQNGWTRSRDIPDAIDAGSLYRAMTFSSMQLIQLGKAAFRVWSFYAWKENILAVKAADFRDFYIEKGIKNDFKRVGNE